MESIDPEMSILSELRSKFEHPAQHIEHIRTTNETILQRDVRQHGSAIKAAIPTASEEDCLLLAASFRYLTVNGLLPEDYALDDYASDVSLVAGHAGGKASRDGFVGLLELLVRLLVESISASFEVLVTTIDEKSSKSPDRTVQAVVMYKHYVKSAERIGRMISGDPETVDVRLVGAILLHGLMMMRRIKRRQVPLWSLSRLYHDVTEKYPLTNGTDLYWDLLRVVVLSPHFDEIVELGRKTIDARLEALEREKKAGRVSTFRVTRSTVDDHGISTAGESVLYEVFRRDGELSAEKTAKLERMLDASLRQAANKKYGKQDLADPELIIDLAANMLSGMIRQFEMIAFGVIPPTRHQEFLTDPRKFVTENQSEVSLWVRKRLQVLSGGAVTTRSMASAFVKLIQVAATTGRSELARR
ncbi:MAG: hypothetical protein HXY34_06445 [Candidatus Thorarchaeota archaeon]|nr:hypothetical protein [Candidatus Thorarchaeota archaeon]